MIERVSKTKWSSQESKQQNNLDFLRDQHCLCGCLNFIGFVQDSKYVFLLKELAFWSSDESNWNLHLRFDILVGSDGSSCLLPIVLAMGEQKLPAIFSLASLLMQLISQILWSWKLRVANRSTRADVSLVVWNVLRRSVSHLLKRTEDRKVLGPFFLLKDDWYVE